VDITGLILRIGPLGKSLGSSGTNLSIGVNTGATAFPLVSVVTVLTATLFDDDDDDGGFLLLGALIREISSAS